MGGALLLGERLAARGARGCAIIFAGMIVCQTPARRPVEHDPVKLSESSAGRILRLLGGLHRGRRLSAPTRRQARGAGGAPSKGLDYPRAQLGVRTDGRRDACFRILKDGASARRPSRRSIWLKTVRRRGGTPRLPSKAALHGCGRGGDRTERAPYSEPTIPLDTSFVIFPGGGAAPRCRARFMLPPYHSPSWRGQADTLGIRDIISISPSLATDAFLRDAFGFPQTNDLATLLVGFNVATT